MTGKNKDLEARLWGAADELRANSKLKASEYSIPVLGLIFLRFADVKFKEAEKQIGTQGGGRRRAGSGRERYQALGVLYLPDEARFDKLLNLPEGENIGQAIIDAMRAIEAENPDLKDVLPKTYNRLENRILVELLKIMGSIPFDLEGDAFGKVYEYFLGKFAMTEGQKGGEFYTPTSIVKLIVEIIEPFHGRIFDPACGSGGMFVQSARFVEGHKARAMEEISVYGQERVAETVRLGKMNLAVHGLAGDIRQGNTYYEDLHKSTGKFDFVMANPPFNVNAVDKERLKDDPRYPFGMRRTDNGNYLWIQHFYSALNDTGRAGFVMANSAADARASELEIRKQLIEARAVDAMVAVGSNFFYTVTLPCTLWFLDKGKANLPPSPPLRERAGVRGRDTVLFLDARHIYRQLDRAHRDFTPQQIEFLANIVRLYRGEAPENSHASAAMLEEYDFLPSPSGRGVGGEGARYQDVFSFLAENRKEPISLGQGAAQQNIIQAVIKKFSSLRPPTELAEQFPNIAEPMMDSIRNLQQKNQTLRQTRDLLLPKLISGELDVSELDVATGQEAA